LSQSDWLPCPLLIFCLTLYSMQPHIKLVSVLGTSAFQIGAKPGLLAC
jgi:hypothetical protein